MINLVLLLRGVVKSFQTKLFTESIIFFTRVNIHTNQKFSLFWVWIIFFHNSSAFYLVAPHFVLRSNVRNLVVCKYFFKFVCPDMKFLNPYHISRYTLTFNICIRTKVEVDQSKAKVGQKVSTSKTSIDHTKSCLKQN